MKTCQSVISLWEKKTNINEITIENASGEGYDIQNIDITDLHREQLLY